MRIEAESLEFDIDDTELETLIDSRITSGRMSSMDIWYEIEDYVPTYDDEIHDLEMQVKNLRTNLKHFQRMAVRANRPNKYARYQ
jgi:hypothetical protein